MKTVKAFTAPLLASFAVLALLLGACEPFERSTATLEIRLPASASGLRSRAPGRRVQASLDAPVRLAVALRPGLYDLRLLAGSKGIVTGYAFVKAVSVLPRETSTVDAFFSTPSSGEPSAEGSVGPGDPLPRAVSRRISGLDADLRSSLAVGTARLRLRIDRDPVSVNDFSHTFPATLALDFDGIFLNASIPAGTALANETARWWFTQGLAQSELLISDCSSFPLANAISYNGATLSGLVEGDPGVGFRPEANAIMDLTGTASYSTTTDALGTYQFGSVVAGTYAATMTITDTVTWSFVSDGQTVLDGLTLDSGMSSFPSLGSSSFTLSSGGIHSLDFRFSGY